MGFKEKEKIRVAAYCRVSTDKEDQAHSLISQRNYFAEYIDRQEGWTLQGVYYDEGISGTQTGKRTGFMAMIEEAMRGGIDLILTKEVSRFARNTVDALFFTRKLKEKGIGVIFTIDHIDTRASDGELRLTIMASLAQEESRKTSERVKWGQKRRMEQGVVFGRDLLGYRVKNGKLEIQEEEVPVIQAIFQKYTNEGKGTHIIARELTQEGFRPKMSGEWSNTAILRILRNEKYAGDLCQKKTYTPDYLTHIKKVNPNPEERIFLRNHHEPIIERELWNRTQEELLRRSQGSGSRYSGCFWCSGKLYCGLCGQRFVSRKKKRRDGTVYRAWKCYAKVRYGRSKMNPAGKAFGCDNRSINEQVLLTGMQYCLCRLLPRRERDSLKEELLREIRRVQEQTEETAGTKQIQTKINAVCGKKRKAVDLLLEGLLSEEEFLEQKVRYEKQMAELSKALTTAREREEDLHLKKDKKEEKLAAALEEILTFDKTNEELYREVLDRMVIGAGQTVEIWLKGIPFGMRLTMETRGRGEGYTAEIVAAEVAERRKKSEKTAFD